MTTFVDQIDVVQGNSTTPTLHLYDADGREESAALYHIRFLVKRHQYDADEDAVIDLSSDDVTEIERSAQDLNQAFAYVTPAMTATMDHGKYWYSFIVTLLSDPNVKKTVKSDIFFVTDRP